MTGLPWNRRVERGHAGLIRVMLWLTLRLGWRTGRALLYPITLYFFLAAPGARAASRGFLARATGQPVSSAAVFRHLFAFATMLLDRAFFLTGRTEGYAISVRGLDRLAAALAEGRGVVLLGAHLGSFEVLRTFARTAPVPVRVLMYRANAGAFSRLIERLDPELAASIIEIGQPESMLRVHESIARGEIVGILADRAPARGTAGAGITGRGAQSIQVPFLGAPAAFPTGPFRLAASLGAPILLFFGVAAGPRRYEVSFEVFALPAATDRREGLAGAVLCYAARLEQQARAAPFNWFNFYDFWDNPPDAPSPSAAGLVPPAGRSAAGGGATGAGPTGGEPGAAGGAGRPA